MAKEIATINQTTEIAKRAFNVVSISDRSGVSEEMDGLDFRFSYVKIPSGGQLAFELPGETDDDVDYVKELKGVIVHHHPVNVYWEKEYTGGNEPPDCVSFDGHDGVGEPGGTCATCPLNQWGSGSAGSDGKSHGKACANRRRVYFLRDGDAFPMLLSIPPTSLSRFSDFISRSVIQKNRRSNEFITKITLKKANSSDGIEYSQVAWSFLEDVDDVSKVALKKYTEDIKAIAGNAELSPAITAELEAAKTLPFEL